MLSSSKIAQIPFQVLKKKERQLKQERQSVKTVPSTKKLKKGKDTEAKEKRREDTLRKTELNRKIIDKYMREQLIRSFTSAKSQNLKHERDQAKSVANKSINKEKLGRKRLEATQEVLVQKEQHIERRVMEKLKNSQNFRKARAQLARLHADFC